MTADSSTRTSGANVSMRTAEEQALDFAEDLGRLLGTAEKKANDWLAQRRDVTKQLTELRDKASQLLERLGGSVPVPVRRRTPGRPRKAAAPSADMLASGSTGSRTRKPMSAAARKAVGERMRKYWAARKRAEKRS